MNASQATREDVERSVRLIAKILGRDPSESALAAYRGAFVGYDRDAFAEACSRWIEANSPDSRMPSIADLRAGYVAVRREREEYARRDEPRTLEALAARVVTPYGAACMRAILAGTAAIRRGDYGAAAKVYRALADEIEPLVHMGERGECRVRWERLAEEYEREGARRALGGAKSARARAAEEGTLWGE